MLRLGYFDASVLLTPDDAYVVGAAPSRELGSRFFPNGILRASDGHPVPTPEGLGSSDCGGIVIADERPNGRHRGEPVLGSVELAGGPLHQPPFLGIGFRLFVIPVGWRRSLSGKLRAIAAETETAQREAPKSGTVPETWRLTARVLSTGARCPNTSDCTSANTFRNRSLQSVFD
jgi:hypothetical protein